MCYAGSRAFVSKFGGRCDESRDHPAFKHLVGDRRRYFVDEHGPHLWVVTQKIHRFLFPLRLWLLSLLPQLFAGRILVFLDGLVRGGIQQWVLPILGAGYSGE